jgi:hypothetical protein
MPAAAAVAPTRWTGITVLYDDGVYSVVAGDYDGAHCLGERWNGSDPHPGFPSQGGNPLYHVVPDFLSRPVLLGLLEQVVRSPGLADRDKFIDKIVKELARW